MSISGQSLGLIETVGLAAAIEAADAAIKSANVELLGYESAKGNGLHTVKLVGDVGAVNAAVDAGVAAASRIGKVYAYKVLARTAEGLEAVIVAGEHVGTNTVPELKHQDAKQTDDLPQDAAKVKPGNTSEKSDPIKKAAVKTPAPVINKTTAIKAVKSSTTGTNTRAK